MDQHEAFLELLASPDKSNALREASNIILSYPAGTCVHLRQPNWGDFRSPLLSDIRETAESCPLCLVVSKVVSKMLPRLAALDDARVRVDCLETPARAKLCISAHAGPTGKAFKEDTLEVYSHGILDVPSTNLILTKSSRPNAIPTRTSPPPQPNQQTASPPYPKSNPGYQTAQQTTRPASPPTCSLLPCRAASSKSPPTAPSNST